MDLINSFLDRYKGIGLKDLELKELVCKIIKQKIGIELQNKDIQRKNNKIIIKTSPLNKNEILLNKREIIKDLVDFRIEDIN